MKYTHKSLSLFFIALMVIGGFSVSPAGVEIAFADTTAAKYVGTSADAANGQDCTWTNPTNVQGDTTGTSASCSAGGNNKFTNHLVLTNFGFTATDIPENSTINGLTLEVEWAGGAAMADTTVQLTKDGSTGVGDNKGTSAAQTSKAFQTYGGSADGWTASLTQADLVSTNFGALLQYQKTAGGGPQGTDVFRARITVDYTPPTIDAPTVSTDAATNIGQTSATLNGQITATGNEDATEHGFAFGTNSSLSGGDTATSTLGGFTGTGSFNENETSLTAGTTYYFRAYATNSGGTGYGTIQNFTTNAIPPDLSQSAYRWFTNTDTTSVGSASGLNTPSIAPSQGTPFRLRMLLHVSSAQLDASATTTKLQFADKSGGTCSGASYSDVQTDAGAIRYFNNSATDDTALTAHHQDPVHSAHNVVAQTYNDGDGAAGADTFSNSEALISSGDDGLWDFALVDNSAAANTTYCFRAVQEGGGVLTAGYEQFPEITTEDVTRVRLLGKVVLRTVRLF